MPQNDGKNYRQKAEEMLEQFGGIPSREPSVGATVGIAYALLAILEEIHAIGERIAPRDKPGQDFIQTVRR